MGCAKHTNSLCIILKFNEKGIKIVSLVAAGNEALEGNCEEHVSMDGRAGRFYSVYTRSV